MRVTIEALADWIRARDHIAIAVHVRPDGDAIGSALAMVHVLNALAKKAVVISPDPVPEAYQFLALSDEVVVGDAPLPFTPTCLLAVDVASVERLGRHQALFASMADTALLDHHGDAETVGYAAINVIQPEAAAAGEVVMALMDALGVPMDTAIATALYTAIATDCGNFNFSNTTAHTLRCAARCIEAGVSVSDITRKLFRLRTVARTRLMGAALHRLEIVGGGKVAVTVLPRTLFADCQAIREDSHSLANYMSEIVGVQIGITIEEQDAATTKCSLRSNDGVNVAKIAAQFGGGGHVAAAGITLSKPLDEAYDLVVRACVAAVEER